MTLKGKWRIVEMALWDLDFLDMMEPAYIFSTTKPGASSPSAASPAKSTAARPRLHLYRPTLADFFNSLLGRVLIKEGWVPGRRCRFRANTGRKSAQFAQFRLC